jgi:hypothetical protein
VHSAKEIHKPITWTELVGSSTQKEADKVKKIFEFSELNPFECQVILLILSAMYSISQKHKLKAKTPELTYTLFIYIHASFYLLPSYKKMTGPKSLLVLPLCRMDLPGPTNSVGTMTDYSVDSWDYSTCAARHLLA